MTRSRLIAVLLIVVLASPALGQILIDFDRLPNGSPTIEDEPIDSLYSSLGVTFKSLDPTDPYPPVFGDFLGAASSMVAKDGRTLSGQQAATILTEFSTPISSVSVEGYTARNYLLTMTAQDETGRVLGSVNSQLTSNFGKGKISLSTIGPIKSVAWTVPQPFPGAAHGVPGIDNLIFTPEVSRLDSRLPPQQLGSKNLVLVTHGWRGDITWVNEMRDSIQDHIHNEHLAGRMNETEWEVRAYDWTDLSNGTPYNALANANVLGVVEGQAIGERHYEHVHLIGHSAGAGLISDAARQVKRNSDTTSVHTTFLDAYAPNITGLLYGTASDWSEHYFNHGDLGWLDSTEATLKNSHNVNVTGLDPTPTPLRADLGHAWPHEFYQESITRDDPFALGYGFKLSREGGRWDPNNYIAGNDPVLLYALPIPEPPKQLVESENRPVIFGGSEPIMSETGIAEITANSVILETGSPAWLLQTIDVSHPASFLTFDLDFTSESGSQGLLSVFLDNQLIGKIDERFVLEDVQVQHLSFSEIRPGPHTLAFRLDPFTEIQSKAKIDNVMLGSIRVIPEPKSILLLLLGIFSLINWLKKRR